MRRVDAGCATLFGVSDSRVVPWVDGRVADVTARVDGFVEMQHVFYPGRNDPQPLRADVVGVLVFQLAGPPSLKLVTTSATYGGQLFDVAVESTSHPTL